MATDDTATVIRLHQATTPRPKTQAERAKAYRERKRKNPIAEKPGFSGLVAPAPEFPAEPARVTNVTSRPVTPVTPSRPVTAVTAVTVTHRAVAPVMLSIAAIGLAGVGITMNVWFARGLGSTELSGWLFLAVGVAADLVALAVPSCAARSWALRQRGTALAGWAIWLATFAFALTASIGFASVNISDVTTSRAGRVTPAVTTAQAALADAVTSRDRECKGGVGKFCRERETMVAERRQALDAAMHTVEQSADPQIEAASRVVAWLSAGLVRPSGDDFAMLRLVLLALLPQLGGLLLMVARPQKQPGMAY